VKINGDRAIVVAALIALALGTGAVSIERDDLPQLCRYTIDVEDADESMRVYFEGLYGPDNFRHLHHYCYGLRAAIDAEQSTDDAFRRTWWLRSIREFEYVLNRVEPTEPIYEEILKAQQASYLALADYYEDQGDLDRAKDTLEEALQRHADDPTFKARLAAVADVIEQ
jgi:tetratricopeptide (TPR) repeat protein